VLDGPAFIEALLSDWAWWPSAVSANVDWLTCLVTIIKVVSDILLARRIRNTILEGVLKDIIWLSTAAGTSSNSAVYDNLSV